MDYTVPCAKSRVHPDGICRKKLHKNIHSGLHKLVERLDTEDMQRDLDRQRQQFEEQRKHLDLQEKMLGVGVGTHRVIKDTRKNKPKADPYLPKSAKPNKNGK